MKQTRSGRKLSVAADRRYPGDDVTVDGALYPACSPTGGVRVHQQQREHYGRDKLAMITDRARTVEKGCVVRAKCHCIAGSGKMPSVPCILALENPMQTGGAPRNAEIGR